MTNGTIDASFMAASAQTNRTTLDNSAAKLYTSTESNNGNFSDYLDTAKQIYSDNSNSYNSYSSNSNVISQNKDYYKDKDTNVIKPKDKTYDKDNDRKVNDNNRDKEKNDVISSKDKDDKTPKDTVAPKEKDSSEKVSDENKNEKPKEKDKKDDSNSQTNDNSQKDDKNKQTDSKSSESGTDGNKTGKVETDKTNIAANAENQAAKVADSIIQAAANTQTTEDKKVTTPNATAQSATDSNAAENQPKIEVKLNTSETDVTNLVKNASSKEPKADLKTQTQQILANLTQQASDTKASDALNKLAQASTPVIQTAEEVNPTLNVGKSSLGQENLKTMLDKIGLTQDLIDKTNARITSVNTNAQNSANFSGQQNAAEQSMKFSIEQASILSGDNKLGATGSQNGIETTFSKNLASTQSGNSISDTEILSQINNKLSMSQDTGESRITMILKPESLGRIHIELQNGKDGLTASLTAENAQVKEALDKNLDSLKNTLNNQGINVSSVNIKLEESQKQSQSDLNQNQEKNEGQNQDRQGASQEKHDGTNQKEQDKGQRDSEEGKSSNEKTLKFAKATV